MIASANPAYPFQVVGTDLFHRNCQNSLIIVDYYSRFWDIEKLYNTESIMVIKKLKKLFARYGIPEILRSDNGAQFV